MQSLYQSTTLPCRARGISAEAARQILVFSFGAEVTQYLGSKALIERVERRVAGMLAPLIGSVVPLSGQDHAAQ